VARDDRSVLAHSGEVAKATRQILGDSATSRLTPIIIHYKNYKNE
jgi:hypothetical protein